MKQFKILLLISLVFLFIGCEDKKETSIQKEESTNLTTVQRWYTDEMVQNGETVYKTNCSSCHGVNGKGVILPWNQKTAEGKYPPPPLNNDAHAWHHPLKALRFTIKHGGKPIGGDMPPFKDKLSNEDIDNVIAYIQNLWSDPYYQEWLKRGGLKK